MDVMIRISQLLYGEMGKYKKVEVDDEEFDSYQRLTPSQSFYIFVERKIKTFMDDGEIYGCQTFRDD